MNKQTPSNDEDAPKKLSKKEKRLQLIEDRLEAQRTLANIRRHQAIEKEGRDVRRLARYIARSGKRVRKPKPLRRPKNKVIVTRINGVNVEDENEFQKLR